MMTKFNTALMGAVLLLIGWGVGTLLHECCHLIGAYACGIPATLGTCTLSTGYVICEGSMTSAQTAIIALAGSLGLVIAGVLMVWLSGIPEVRMIGIIFLARAWIDVLPLAGYDGGLIVGSAGYVIAGVIVIAEVLVCGSVILDAVSLDIAHKPLYTQRTETYCSERLLQR